MTLTQLRATPARATGKFWAEKWHVLTCVFKASLWLMHQTDWKEKRQNSYQLLQWSHYWDNQCINPYWTVRISSLKSCTYFGTLNRGLQNKEVFFHSFNLTQASLPQKKSSVPRRNNWYLTDSPGNMLIVCYSRFPQLCLHGTLVHQEIKHLNSFIPKALIKHLQNMCRKLCEGLEIQTWMKCNLWTQEAALASCRNTVTQL